jgi:hypothetical protein
LDCITPIFTTFDIESITKLNMKSILLFSLIVSFSLDHTVSIGQTCSQQITAFMAAPGGYNISGTGLLQADPEGTTLSFDNAFNTQSGPDLHVYLSINFESPTTPGNTNIDIAELTSNNGAQTYTIPSNVSLGDYNYVLIHCKSFNHWWGGGLLGEIDCGTATNNLTEEISISPYPNPATNYVIINSPTVNVTKIMIMDMNGRIRITQSVSSQEQLKVDINELENGMFFILGLNQQGAQLFRKKIITL